MLDETLFDLDYPGHYMRRLKNVSLTIPAVTGPHTSVNCTLTLLSSQIRTSTDTAAEYSETDPPGNDARFWYRRGATRAVCTSSAQNDSGMFELNFRDERLLPFEGEGAVRSRWRIELPAATNRFDLDSVSDVVLHLSYTAREGGAALGEVALAAASAAMPPTALRILGVSQELSAEWSAFETELDSETHDQVLRFSLEGKLPFVPGVGATRVTRMRLSAVWDGEPPGQGLDAAVTPAGSETHLDVTIKSVPDLTADTQEISVEDAGPWEVHVTQTTLGNLTEFTEPVGPQSQYLHITPTLLKEIYLVINIERDPLP